MTIRWGIIGCGNVTEVKSGPGLQHADDSQLVAVMRRSASRAEDYARRHRVPRWYDDADSLIADPEVDAVYIATPPGAHLEYALKACRVGKPAYVEKPMARNYGECAEMCRAFEEARLPLFVAYYRRALPRFLKIKELLDSGSLGCITSVNYRLSKPREEDLHPQKLPWRVVAMESGGGLFFDLGSHALDLLDFLLGPLRDYSGHACNSGSVYHVEETVVMHFLTQSGVPGVASWNFGGAHAEDVMEIHGTEATVSFPIFGNEPVVLRCAGETSPLELPNPKHIQQPLIQTIVDELLERGECPSTGDSAARTSRVMDAVVENYYGSRADEFWTDSSQWPGRPKR